MQVKALSIPDVKLITPNRIADGRGAFSELYSQRALAAAGLNFTFVQDNQSLSDKAPTVRGLHFQTPPLAQNKLVRCIRGGVLDIAVDIRRGSPTYGHHVVTMLSEDRWEWLLVPVGFAHGFVTLQPGTEVFYKVDNYYSAAHDAGILWNDPDLGIDWCLDGRTPLLSDKDTRYPRLRDFASPFVYRS